MAPLRSYTNWGVRASNNEEQIEPRKSYYFICEGQNTERWYFEKFIDMRNDFGIHPLIAVEYLEKTDEHRTWSDPKKLLELAINFQSNPDITFDPAHDTMIMVFDADIFEGRPENAYTEFVADASKVCTLCVTNPSFELFLLLHFENSYKEIIAPNASDIIANNKVPCDSEEVRYIESLFYAKSGLRPKKDQAIEGLVANLPIAIGQEKNINSNILNCRNNITSNIGLVLASIIHDK